MNSFTVVAIGNLTADPELTENGDANYTRFCLIGNDYAGKDSQGVARTVATSVWFVAFGATAEAIADNARKGDQLIVEARIRPNNWTDKHDQKRYDHSFQVLSFRFGAPGKLKRQQRADTQPQTLVEDEEVPF